MSFQWPVQRLWPGVSIVSHFRMLSVGPEIHPGCVYYTGKTQKQLLIHVLPPHGPSQDKSVS